MIPSISQLMMGEGGVKGKVTKSLFFLRSLVEVADSQKCEGMRWPVNSVC